MAKYKIKNLEEVKKAIEANELPIDVHITYDGFDYIKIISLDEHEAREEREIDWDSDEYYGGPFNLGENTLPAIDQWYVTVDADWSEMDAFIDIIEGTLEL